MTDLDDFKEIRALRLKKHEIEKSLSYIADKNIVDSLESLLEQTNKKIKGQHGKAKARK